MVHTSAGRCHFRWGCCSQRNLRPTRASQSDETAKGEDVGKNTTNSVGTMLQTLGNYVGFSQKATQPTPPSVSPSTRRYLESLELTPGLKKLLGEAKLVDHLGSGDSDGSLIHTASDYSYSANTYAGDGWRVIGDAGAFIDPFFSSGIHLAFTGALSAAVSISASIRGDCNEKEACGWHTERVTTSFTRYLVIVLSAYKQIRSQKESILADFDEDNFDRALQFFRPVIQGGSDMGHRLSEGELQQTLDFCSKLFLPTSPEDFDAARKTLAEGGAAANSDPQVANTKLMDPRTPLVNPQTIESVVSKQRVPRAGDAVPDSKPNEGKSIADPGSDEVGVREVLEQVNARRVLFSEQAKAVHNFEDEPLGQSETGGGWVARLERGKLGLVPTDRVVQA